MPEATRQTYSYRGDPLVPGFDDSCAIFAFDGHCVLCSTGARWLMRYDGDRKIRFASAQGKVGGALFNHYGVDPDATYLFVNDGRAFTETLGYLEMCKLLGGPWRLFAIAGILPERWLDRAYRFVARNRYRWFGKTGQCALLTQEQRARLI